MLKKLQFTLALLALSLAANISVAQPTPLILLPDRQLDGNRLIKETLPLGSLRYQSVLLPDVPIWANGFREDDGALWYVRTRSGALYRVVAADHVHSERIEGTSDTGPLLLLMRDGRWIPQSPDTTASELLLHRFVSNAPQPLSDAQPVVSAKGDIVYLADPTDRYRHSILGDAVEAGAIVVFPDALSGIPGRPVVIELAPLVAEERGVVLHDIEIAAVRTPHIGGVLKSFSFTPEHDTSGPGDSPGLPRLREQTVMLDVSSHKIGSRNLGDAWIININGDDQWEILLPRQNRREIVVVARGRGGSRELWQSDLGAALSSNLAIARWYGADREGSERRSLPDLHNPGPALLAGTEDGRLHIWW